MKRWLVVILLVAFAAPAQDPEWMRQWLATQKGRPAAIPARSRIAPKTEPGVPLKINGRVVLADGKTAAPNVVVFAYQTDATGVYQRRNAAGWRLHGWARTDAAGRFEFETIRPAPYPGRSIAAHIHMTIEGPNVPRQYAPDILFADDPLLTAREREQSRHAGAFGSIRTVSKRHGVEHVDVAIRAGDEDRF